MDRAFLNTFKNPELSRGLLERITVLAKELEKVREGKPIQLMEVCGTHTVAIAQSGLRGALPQNIRLMSGPGCPVCVTSQEDIDRCIAASRVPNIFLTTFGDMMRVPGSSTSLLERRAEGASIEVVYSPLDALTRAAEHPKEQVVFIGVGFETTTPLIAATIKRAAQAGIENFSVLALQKRVTPALEALAKDPDIALDGLLLPGHVSTIIGSTPYLFLPTRYGIPTVIAGFEPVDLLLALVELLEQILAGEPRVEIAYGRAVREEGNEQARAVIDELCVITDASWRGLGLIPNSGYRLKDEFACYDALRRFDIASLTEPTREPKGCRCGDVLRGRIPPSDCRLFGKGCTPSNPIGPCMVSGEGSCAAYYKYQIKA